MPRATLHITIPEDVWIGDLSRSYPEGRFRILAALPGEETGVGLTEISAEDAPAVIRAIESYESVIDVDLLRREGGTALLQFETTEPLLLFPVQSSGVPLEMPFDIVDGTARWELTAPRDRLSDLADQLEVFDIEYDVEELRQHVEPEQLLTDQQLAVIQTAVESGYYDTPRTCTLTELADTIGVAKSTCSETLHRAEGKIVKRFLEEDTPD